MARLGHFGRAAQAVHVTQSALSQQVIRLEAELGVRLFERGPKGVALTPAGEELEAHAATVLAEVTRARAAIDAHRGAARGVARLAVTAHDASEVPAALVAFHRAHPQIQLSLRHCGPDELIELITGRTVDAGIVGVDGEPPQIPRVPAGAVVQILSEEPLCLICAADDHRAGSDQLAIEALRGVPVILPERGSALRALIAESCQAAGFSPLPLFEASDRLTVRTLAAEGLAYGAVPRSWLQGDGPQVGVATFADPPRYRVAVIHNPELPPAGTLLVRHLTAFLGSEDG